MPDERSGRPDAGNKATAPGRHDRWRPATACTAPGRSASPEAHVSIGRRARRGAGTSTARPDACSSCSPGGARPRRLASTSRGASGARACHCTRAARRPTAEQHASAGLVRTRRGRSRHAEGSGWLAGCPAADAGRRRGGPGCRKGSGCRRPERRTPAVGAERSGGRHLAAVAAEHAGLVCLVAACHAEWGRGTCAPRSSTYAPLRKEKKKSQSVCCSANKFLTAMHRPVIQTASFSSSAWRRPEPNRRR